MSIILEKKTWGWVETIPTYCDRDDKYISRIIQG